MAQASIVRFTATRLAARGKKGIMKVNADGYYEICLGALNILNFNGDFWCLDGAEALFKNSSILMRRIREGNLKSEEGHPKFLPGMTVDQFVARNMHIEETNVCAHIGEVWLDADYGKNLGEAMYRNAVGIIGLVKPAGPLGDSLKESFDNPKENVNFSIRSVTNDHIERGRRFKVLSKIITWDHVTEPGIAVANKYDTLSTESIMPGQSLDMPITKNQLERMLDGEAMPEISTENSREIIRDILQTFNSPVPAFKPPVYTNWR